MRRVGICLVGPGNVGRHVFELLIERQTAIADRYGLLLEVRAVSGSDGAALSSGPLELDRLVRIRRDGFRPHHYPLHGRAGMSAEEVAADMTVDVLVLATPTDLGTGGPGLGPMRVALSRGLDVVTLDKGGLVREGKSLFALAKRNRCRIRYSGATAAALPAIDLIDRSLAGAGITRVAGVLNGTTNYILDAMERRNLGFSDALAEAQDRGIAEPDPSADVNGWDTAAKLALLASAAFGQWLDISDIEVTGIAGVTLSAVKEAQESGGTLRLVGDAVRMADRIEAAVMPQVVGGGHVFSLARGSDKAIQLTTDTMGQVAAVGGGADPRAAAAAAVKDIINLFRADR